MGYKGLSRAYYQSDSEYEMLYNQRVSSEATTFLGIKIHENEAFYCLCPEIYELSAKIMAYDKSVALLCESLPGVALEQFANKCLIDEIQLSNDIEHVNSTRKELTEVLEELHTKKENKRFYGLVKKYSMLREENLSLNSCADIRNIYNELVLSEVVADDPDNAPDGVFFRKGMAEVTSSTQKIIHHGAFPEEKIILLMERSLQILNNENIPALVRISLFHYFFGYIHPFYDGNGRTSRFISSYLLAREFEPLIGYRLSYTIKENLKKYYKAFQECNSEKNRGDMTPFIIMFLEIICESFENLDAALRKRCDALSHYKEKIKIISEFTKDEKEFSFLLLQAALFAGRGLSKKEISSILSISASTVDKRLAKMRNTKLLTEKRGARAIQYLLDLSQLQGQEN